MLIVACVWWGDKYSKDYVNRLHAMVARNITMGVEGKFVCFTDQPDELHPQIEKRPLPTHLNGWFKKLWLFSRDLFDPEDRIVYFDLDTVIVGDLDPLIAYDGEFLILRDFYRPNGWQASVMAWRAGFGHRIFDEWIAAGNPEKFRDGDQGWLEHCNKEGWISGECLQDKFPGMFCSYKVDCHPFPPENSSVVVFHGEPKPHECSGWVEAMWTEGDTGHFQLKMIPNVTLETIRAQSAASAARGLPRLFSRPAHSRSVALVGGGPSLGDPITFVELQRRHAEGCAIWALNGTYDWLLHHGFAPEAIVIVDARQANVRFLRNLKPGTKVYLASQCHPDVYEVAGTNIVRVDLDVMGDCGTTVGTHAILIAFVEGYRTIHLYGYDSSYRNDEGHAYKQPLNVDERVVDATIYDRKFRAAPWMVRQAQDFEGIAKDVTAAGGQIIVHGDGLLPYMAQILSNPLHITGPQIRAREILKRMNGAEHPHGVEVGVFAGDTSKELLARENLHLTMVDSWEGNGAAYVGDTGDYHANLQQYEQERLYLATQEAVKFAGTRAHILRVRSIEAASIVADGFFDFVFIDADHSYEGCKSDIEAWLPKVKRHGFIGGHDYINPDFPKFGVKRAVDELAASLGQSVDLGDNFTWFLRKD